MQINLTFNGYQEMKNFCQQIIGEMEKPDLKHLNETAMKATEIINRAEEKEEKQKKKPGRKPGKKLMDILEKETPRKKRTTITDEIREEVLDYWNDHYSANEIAGLTGISFSSVMRIINAKK